MHLGSTSPRNGQSTGPKITIAVLRLRDGRVLPQMRPITLMAAFPLRMPLTSTQAGEKKDLYCFIQDSGPSLQAIPGLCFLRVTKMGQQL